MDFDEAVDRYFRWTEKEGLTPEQPSSMLSIEGTAGWVLANISGELAFVKETGEIWALGDSAWIEAA